MLRFGAALALWGQAAITRRDAVVRGWRANIIDEGEGLETSLDGERAPPRFEGFEIECVTSSRCVCLKERSSPA